MAVTHDGLPLIIREMSSDETLLLHQSENRGIRVLSELISRVYHHPQDCFVHRAEGNVLSHVSALSAYLEVLEELSKCDDLLLKAGNELPFP